MALARKDSDSSDGGSVANDDGIDVTVEDSAKLLNGSSSRGGDGGASHRAGRYMDDDDEDMEGGSHRDLKVQCVLICLGLVVAAVFAMLLAEVLRQGEPQRPPADTQAAVDAFVQACTADGARESLRYYTDGAHLAGSIRDKETAEWTRDKLKSFGITDVYLDTYEVLINEPATGDDISTLAILTPASMAYTAKLTEAKLHADPMSNRPHTTAFHGYSPSGEVIASVVYANYGRVEDFAKLKAKGVNVAGSIALVRYGRIFRGNKVENAQANGAVGVIIYSDPADDGFRKGTVYPEGPWRPPSSIQRGSVFTGEGDPLTPMYPATHDGFRLTMREGRDKATVDAGWALPTIPSLPIGYGDAEPLLRSLSGAGPAVSTVDSSWQGGLDFDYYVGPGPAQVQLKVGNTFAVKTIWNVIATIPGQVEPDRWVVIGNHRDAWVAGAVDPSSGSAAMIEVGRGLGSLLATGWKPRRSLVLASWDMEEYGLVGSVEFVEANVHLLKTKAVAYINVDTAVSSMGSIVSRATPALSSLMQSVAKQVPMPPCVGVNNTDPATSPVQLCKPEDYAAGDSVYDFWLRADPLPGSNPLQPNVPVLGSGSDHTAFIAHSGIAALDLFFEAKNDYYAVYHSVYDSFTWMATFGDPSFKYHKAAAQLWGAAALRLADDAVLPFDYVAYANALKRFTTALADHTAELGGSDGVPAGGVNGAVEATGNVVAGSPPATPHTLDLSRLRRAVDSFAKAARNMAAAIELVNIDLRVSPNSAATTLRLRSLNDKLMLTERAMIADEGLPGRSWYKHVVFSPSEHNAYGATSFPGVQDALAVGDWRLAQRQLDVVCHLIQRAAAGLTVDVLAATPAQTEAQSMEL